MALKILVVSNFYPPIRSGGYAQLCAEVCQGLSALGHHIAVLASRYGAERMALDDNVYRLLYLENDLLHYSVCHLLTRWLYEEKMNRKLVADIVARVCPDVAFVWGMYGLSRGVAASLEQLLPGRTLYFISDMWPVSGSLHQAYWRAPASSVAGRVTKKLLHPLASFLLRLGSHPMSLSFEHSIVVSDAIRKNLLDAGHPAGTSVVIHSGVETEEYFSSRDFDRFRASEEPLRLLYAGNLGYHKGVHTAIEALGLLSKRQVKSQFRLDIYGTGHPQYEAVLTGLIENHGLGDVIAIMGRVPREEMPRLLMSYDVLLLPSVCDDALPRIVQEAMLSGLVIIASDRGGIPEMVTDGDTGLLCPAEDPSCLATQIERLLNDRDLAVTLARNGQLRARDAFCLDVMVDKIDRCLRRYERDGDGSH